MLENVLGNIVTGCSIVTTSVNGTPFGMTASWVSRISNNPFMVSISISTKNNTHDKLKKSLSFGINVMSWDAIKIIMHFGKKTGRICDKFKDIEIDYSPQGNPIILCGAIAFIDCNIVEKYKAGDHTVFMAEVINGNVTGKNDPIVYYAKKYYKINGEKQKRLLGKKD